MKPGAIWQITMFITYWCTQHYGWWCFRGLGSGCSSSLLQQLLHLGDVISHRFLLGLPCSDKSGKGCVRVNWEFGPRDIAHMEQVSTNLQRPSKHPILLCLSGRRRQDALTDKTGRFSVTDWYTSQKLIQLSSGKKNGVQMRALRWTISLVVVQSFFLETKG